MGKEHDTANLDQPPLRSFDLNFCRFRHIYCAYVKTGVSKSLVSLTRKIVENSQIDLVVERLSSRLIVEVDCKLAIQISWAARLNLALNFSSEPCRSSILTILDEVILLLLTRRQEIVNPQRVVMSKRAFRMRSLLRC